MDRRERWVWIKRQGSWEVTRTTGTSESASTNLVPYTSFSRAFVHVEGAAVERGRRHFVQISLLADSLNGFWTFEFAVRIEATLPCAGRRQAHTHRPRPKRDQYTHRWEEVNLIYVVDGFKASRGRATRRLVSLPSPPLYDSTRLYCSQKH